MPKYKYHDALRPERSEIRLLTILPQTHHDCCGQDVQLHCSMDRASLADKPSYNALSYTWGAPNFTQSICINGRCFRVTKNLQSALFHLRQQHESVVVWIDAVCINQKDNEEKSHQVQQMQRIYEEAQLVLIWLGPARDESDVAMDSLKQIGEQYAKSVVIKRWEFRCFCARWLHLLVNFRDDKEDEEDDGLTLEQILSQVTNKHGTQAALPTGAIYHLLQRPWWQRVWVVQELGAARKAIFMCGSRSIDANRMSTALTIFRLALQAVDGSLYITPGDHVPAGIDSRPYLMLGSRMMTRAKLPLLHLIRAAFPYMQEHRRLNATDPRDVIFALCGLSRDADSLGIQPNYMEDCSQVFTHTARALINDHCGLDLLRHCFFPKSQSQLPSWVPDWSAEPVGRRLLYGQGPDGNGIEFGSDKSIANVQPRFDAAQSLGDFVACREEDVTSNLLRLRGLQVDVVTSILEDDVKMTFDRSFDPILPSLEPVAFFRASPDEPYQLIEHNCERDGQPARWPFRSGDQAVPVIVPQGGPASNVTGAGIDNQSLFVIAPQGGPASNVTDAGFGDEEPMFFPPLPNPHEENPEKRAFLTAQMITPDLCIKVLKLVGKLISSVRDLLPPHSEAYRTGRAREDAIWRTLINDQDVNNSHAFIRPSKVAVLFRLGAKMCEGAPGLEGIISKEDEPMVEHLLSILTEKKLMQDLTFEQVRQMHKAGDSGSCDFDFVPEETAIALFKAGVLANWGFTSEEEVRAGVQSGALDLKDIFLMLLTQIKEAFKFPDRKAFESITAYPRMMRAQMLGRRPFSTRSGYLGMGPQSLRTNDIVVLLQGAATPFLLRPRRDGRHYKLVGEVYVHGIMDGEFCREQKPLEEFVLE